MQIFVYGPLMPNLEKWSAIAEMVNKTSRASVKARLYHLPYGFPAIVEGRDNVYGYVLDLPDTDEVINAFDLLFGYYKPQRDNFYEKKNLPVIFEDGSTGEALVYLFEGYRADELPSFGTYIPHGDWKKFIIEQQNVSA